MKRLLLWTFDRGSFQWDILCLLILAFLFAIPRDSFQDVPEFMKLPATASPRKTVKDGNEIYTSKLESPRFVDSDEMRVLALSNLERSLGEPVHKPGIQPRIQPIRDWTGRVLGYAIWKEK
jgi:hypothetical protein